MMSAALNSFAPSIAHLRTIATPVTEYRVLPFGVNEIDSRLGAGGLRAECALHEATAQSAALVNDAATTLFLAGIAAREAANTGGPVLWASCRADLYAPALREPASPLPTSSTLSRRMMPRFSPSSRMLSATARHARSSQRRARYRW